MRIMKKTIATTAWDAELDTDVCDPYNNADLTLRLKIAFRQINPPDGARAGMYNDFGDANSPVRKIVRWNPAEWMSWKSNFIATASRHWNGKFWLVNNFSKYAYTYKEIKYIPNVWCRLNLVAIDAGVGTHHHLIDVVRLDKSELWFGSHARLFDNLDVNLVRKGMDSRGRFIMQRANVHEIGHLLGLGHVDAGKQHCIAARNVNAAACYGVTDRDKYSVMGQGMQLRDEHAHPWRRAIALISGKGNTAANADWVPRKDRHFPRTLAEVAANASITAMPTR